MLSEEVRLSIDPAHVESHENNLGRSFENRQIDRLKSAIGAVVDN